MPSSVSTDDELDRRKIIGIEKEQVTNIGSTDAPNHYPDEDNSWSLERFKEQVQVTFYRNDPLEASFSLVGVDASLANAFRRILIAEVPTLAIEKVYVNNNTSVIADEVLSQRLGLIPLKGAVDGLNWLKWRQKNGGENHDEEENAMDYNTVVLKLKVECTRKEGVAANVTEPTEKYEHAHVYARDLEWIPAGRQDEFFNERDGGTIEPVNPNILLAKLRPGQVIDMDLHAVKGIGMDHAKFSPVATAMYRLMPTITITQPILGAEARKFQKCFSKGVIDVARVTPADARQIGSGYEGREGDEKAVVVDAFRDTVSRECLRHDEFKDKVKLGRVRDHFIFKIESTGQFDSDLLFEESVKILKLKAMRLKRELNKPDQ